ncbi:cell division control protein 2 [Purpureocillium lavendulum]|uniref:Cell division control protein 2 n=1 Tax=Purpureocillium lavendulum TaxID=1247861 RepID=A0AB34FVJ3_9HYPO|nr:cell division control protein 2 [Purpureocillium lavendulum]
MPERLSVPTLLLSVVVTTALSVALFPATVYSNPTSISGALHERNSNNNNNPLNIDWDPAPAPEDGPAFSAGALRNPKYLPAEIGGIVAAYGVSLVLVAITLLSLAKKRREHLQGGDDDFALQSPPGIIHIERRFSKFAVATPRTATVPNFSYPSPINTQFEAPESYIYPSPTSSATAPGVDPSVDQSVVQADRDMAQQQLEEMYKHVMEHEDAKERGVVLDTPVMASHPRVSSPSSSKKERTKPANLKLTGDGKPQSKTASLLSALRSPRKKAVKGVSISSPIMTPQSSTFPRQQEPQEMNPMSPRHYAPPPPPPIPTDQISFGASRVSRNGAPLTPDISPESVQSIDERISAQLGPSTGGRLGYPVPSEADPESATSEHSQVPLVGLPASPTHGPRSPTWPSSPGRGPRSPTLPASPKPGASFQRSNVPSAVRTGGSLPLRAYEQPMASPSTIARTTKQTVFERRGPLSPTTGRTPRTAGAVPYSPYQPFTPVVPVTPSLVTKEDRKRMKRAVPKTPTMEMVQSSDDMW